MTAIALRQQQSSVLSEINSLTENNASQRILEILNKTLASLKSAMGREDVGESSSYGLSDEELDTALASRPVFDETRYVEPSDEDWKVIVRQRNGRLTKGLEKWL